MVALNEKFHHNGTTAPRRGLQGAGYGLQRDDFLIDQCSLVFKCSARNRNYSPSLGRWINQGPAGYINGANTYQFVESNPAGNVDPLGLAGVGIIGTGSGVGGWVYGSAVTGSAGTGVFVGPNGTATGGSFAAAGGAVGGPGISTGVPGNTGQTDGFFGAYTGIGAGVFLTNASNVSQLGGPFSQWNLDLWLFSISIESSNGVWLCSITGGPADGAAVTAYPTTTVTPGPTPLPPAGTFTDWGIFE